MISTGGEQTSPCLGRVAKEDVCVVIPTLNEEEAIGGVISELKNLGYNDIVVVDGYSNDRTVEMVEKAGARVVSQHGAGKTGAVRTAVDCVDRHWMVVMDGDFSYDPRGIELMLAHGTGYDEVIGARSNGREHIPLMNRFGNWVITSVFKLLFGGSLTDVCSGMYLIRTDVARHLDFTTKGFEAEVEVASQVASTGRITEVPIVYRARIGRRKLSSLKDGIAILTAVFRLANIHNPVLLYSGMASFALIPAAAIILWVLWESVVYHVWHSGYALFGVMLLLLATQAITVATLSIIIKRSSQQLLRVLRWSLSGREPFVDAHPNDARV